MRRDVLALLALKLLDAFPELGVLGDELFDLLGLLADDLKEISFRLRPSHAAHPTRCVPISSMNLRGR